MKSEAQLRDFLREIIRESLPHLDPEGVWPYPCDYRMTQKQHWFYCLVWALELERREREPLRGWMQRLEKELS